MEEGSLLQEALQQSKEQHYHQEVGDDNNHHTTTNTLLLDVYLLPKISTTARTTKPNKKKGDDSEQRLGVIQHLLDLAKLAAKCNQFIGSQGYPWHFGGDGPVFGIFCSSGGSDSSSTDGSGRGGEYIATSNHNERKRSKIPHLRAYCRYGPSVRDEWMAIRCMVEMTKFFSNNSNEDDNYDIAVSCWDVDDGQVILIQTADVLPDWLDEDPTDKHRYACWLRQGRFQLLRQRHMTLQQALNKLQNQTDAETQQSSHPQIQNALQQWLERIIYNNDNKNNTLWQRTPLVVPRTIATMIRNRPDLIHAAIQAFCDNIDLPPPDLSTHEDWVWTVAHRGLSRTNYAMARTMVSSEWEQPGFVPPTVGVEVKRYQRKCAMDATPHLQHAVALGVRLVAGVAFLTTANQEPSTKRHKDVSFVEQRITHWCRLDQDCQHPNTSKQMLSSWILESFQQGPNHAVHDLQHVLKCPVFPEEAGRSLTLRTNPETSIRQQVINAQKQNFDEDEEFAMPLADQVDDEGWLSLEDGRFVGDNNNDLDQLLSRFQNFMVQPSDVQGVVSSSLKSSEPTLTTTKKEQMEIRPRIFMNILHAVLKDETISFPSASIDPFFYQEDYDLMENVAEEYDDDEQEETNENVREMKGLMVSMLPHVGDFSYLIILLTLTNVSI